MITLSVTFKKASAQITQQLIFVKGDATMNIIIFMSFLVLSACQDIQNYIGTDLQKCFNCLCHARTGCYNRYNCARYSIDMEYWETAGSPTVNNDHDSKSISRYQKCMSNENCILATLDQYANQIGHMDCNCDGLFDCKDRFAIHLFGSGCTSPKFKSGYVQRFNTCAKSIGVAQMLSEEEFKSCSIEIF